MSFDPRINRNEKDAIGDPGDAIATNTTEAWTSISLLKGIAAKLGVGGSFSPATDVPQDSTTAGQTGGLTQAAVTTAAPTYTTGKTDPLSLKTNGDLRVSDTAGTALLTTMGADISTLKFQTDTLEAAIGILTETAPATDTASAGLNGRLQRVAQNLTTLTPYLDGVETLLASLHADLAGSSSAAAPLPSLNLALAELLAAFNDRAAADDVSFDQLHLDMVMLQASLTGPTATARLLSAGASTNAANVKGTAGKLFSIQGYTAASAVRYLKLYDKATAPTVGTDTPIKTIALPAATGFALDWPRGYAFKNGLGYALTTAGTDADTSALTAGDVLGLNLDYV